MMQFPFAGTTPQQSVIVPPVSLIIGIWQFYPTAA